MFKINERYRTACTIGLVIGGMMLVSAVTTAGEIAAVERVRPEADNCRKTSPGVGFDNLITTIQCEISVYHKYGLAEQVAEKKEELASAMESRRRSQMDGELSKCWGQNTIVTSDACRVAVFTRYGMATELAKAKQALAKDEQDQAKTDERTRQLVADAAERKRQRELEKAKLEQRCQQAPTARVGMTELEVLHSNWGTPSERHTTTNISHYRQQWVYTGGPDCGPRVQSYLYFEDGVLTTIQD